MKPGFPDPDWNRFAVGVHSRAKQDGLAPLGDPFIWGGESRDLVPNFVVNPIEIVGAQIIRIQTKDTYSRSFALLGSLSMPTLQWGAPAASLQCLLAVTMGAGRLRMTHYLDMRLLTTIGLTVYAPDFASMAPATPNAETRAFAAVGALIGQAIEVRPIFRVFAAVATLPTTIVTRAIVTPFAAGEGL